LQLGLTGKTDGLDHIWQDHIDYQKLELSACRLVMYVNYYLTGQIWSIRRAFAECISKYYIRESQIKIRSHLYKNSNNFFKTIAAFFEAGKRHLSSFV
jgi:hypothetical protein